MDHPDHKYREALELVERHLGESLTVNQIAQVVAVLVMIMQERLDAEKKGKP